jgi:hypothetical protein
MHIFDFITQDEIEDLPQDPNSAFVAFVRHASARLGERLNQLSGIDEQLAYNEAEEARHGFMNVLIAAAKRYQISPFSAYELPLFENFSVNAYRSFRADLDHYLTQMVLDNAIRERGNSVDLSSRAKDRIRSHVHGLKMCIDNADLSEAKKEALLKKLSLFEAELEKRRLGLLAVTVVALEIMALPGGAWATYDMVQKLTANILSEVGEAKVAEDEARRLAPSEPPHKLLPPRNADDDIGASNADDDIPF